MPAEVRWTSAMRQTWGYVLSGIEGGLSGAENLRQYRAGGGAIRTQDFYSLRRSATEAYGTQDRAAGLPADMPIPGVAHTGVDWDYGKEYVVVAEMKGTDPVTGDHVTREITSMSDETHTLSEWEGAIMERNEDAEDASRTETPEIGRLWFYIREWTGMK